MQSKSRLVSGRLPCPHQFFYRWFPYAGDLVAVAKQNGMDFVSFTDLAPTFLDAAGVEVPGSMTGTSLLPVPVSGKAGGVDAGRDFVVYGRERHTTAQKIASQNTTKTAAQARLAATNKAIKKGGRSVSVNTALLCHGRRGAPGAAHYP